MNLPHPCRPATRPRAFTLIEVMIAVTIFFMAMFTILGVLAASLHAASILKSSAPTADMVAGQLSLTNKLEEGTLSGDFGEIPIYDGYRWMAGVSLAATNGLYQVEIAVLNPSGQVDSTLNILLYKPDTQGNHMGLH